MIWDKRLDRGLRTGWVLVAWMLVAAGLRFWGLGDKPVWSDEWATLVFSQGHSFRAMPLGIAQPFDQFLDFLRWGDRSLLEGLGDVWRALMTESTHPPLYFWLCHLWLRLWQSPGDLVSVELGRALSAGLGVLTVPVAYGLGRGSLGRGSLGQRSLGGGSLGTPQRRESHRLGITLAGLMALSPFGVYLAQDVRHYTLALLWVMASLGYFLAAWRSLRSRPDPSQPRNRWASELSWTGCGLWVGVNALGLATHYFVGLLLLAEGLVLGLAALGQRNAGRLGWPKLGTVALGTLLGALPWIWFWQRIPGDRLTEWVTQDVSWLERWLMPLVRLLAWLVTMVALLPLEQVPWPVALLSGLGLLAAIARLGPPLGRRLGGIFKAGAEEPRAIALQGLGYLLACQLLLVLGIVYFGQRDLTLATRYFFVFLPGVLLGVAIALQDRDLARRCGPLIFALGWAGSLSVAQGYAFQKPDRPDLVVQSIMAQRRLEEPLLMLTMDKTHEQLGEMLGLAWAWRQQLQQEAATNAMGASLTPDSLWFLITRRGGSLANNTSHVYWGSAHIPRPYELWEFNLAEGVVFEVFACEARSPELAQVPGYLFKSHRCR